MIAPRPTILEGYGVRLEPLERQHTANLVAAAADGELWKLWYVSVADLEPGREDRYIDIALAGLAAGHMLPWVVRELTTGTIIGSTRYHDIVTAIDRVEIGYTFYARQWQRTHVNAACKLLLLEHAFDMLG
ncbi:MAG: GNAT family N-acetyltransferase, partial [Vicinamibacterales bacterium]